MKGTELVLVGVDHLNMFVSWLQWAYTLATLDRPVLVLEGGGDMLLSWYAALVDAKDNLAFWRGFRSHGAWVFVVVLWLLRVLLHTYTHGFIAMSHREQRLFQL